MTSPQLLKPPHTLSRTYEEARKEWEREMELWQAVTKAGLVENGRMKNDTN